MKLHTLTTLGAIAIAGMLISSPALAAYDWKTYPGSNCESYYGSQAGDFIVGNRSIRNNHSTSSRWVICPIVIDNGKAYGGVTVNHRLPTGTNKRTVCYVFNRTAGGNSYTYGSVSQVSTTTSQRMSINTNKRSNTHYQILQCLLPPKGELNSYEVLPYLF